MKIDEYFDLIEKNVRSAYAVATKAKETGIDPVNKVEIPIAMSLAEKAVGLISTIYPQLDSKIVERILELEKQYGQLDSVVAFQIAEEIAREKFCKFENLLQAMDAGIRVGFSYITLGVVSSPLEGFTQIKTAKTRNNEDYIVAYFSGPIRSAGTTASCMVLMLIDYLREKFGFAKYDPTDEEVRRYVTENVDYHERVTNLQYLPSEDEIVFLAKNLPIQISGEPTEEREVSNYKGLARIETDQIRGGMCLIFSEGLAQKAQKGLRLWNAARQKGIEATGWTFLEEYITKYKKKSKGSGDNVPTYIKDLVAGRPIYGHPGRSGGFRFRYGRTRTSGFSANAVHPATMAVTDSFLSFGTQLKIEKPTKGCVVSVSDQIDGPIVKLRNGSVKKLIDFEEARKIYPEVEEIIYLGDMLVPFGDVINRNYDLLKPGYVEEWWYLELQKAAAEKGEKIEFDKFNVRYEDALLWSKRYNIPLYPRYIYYWKEISKEEFLGLIDWLARGIVTGDKLVLPYAQHERQRFAKGKRALELVGCGHNVYLDNVIIEAPESKALLYNLGVSWEDKIEDKFNEISLKIKEKIVSEEILEVINFVSNIKIKDKSGAFIGSRMGRPEKAKLRKLIGNPHAMFPVGEEGGRLRSFQAAIEKGFVKADFSIFYCNSCKIEEIYPRCHVCGEMCVKMNYCSECQENVLGKCEIHEKIMESKERNINIGDYFQSALKMIGLNPSEVPVVKGVRGTSNKDHSCEHLAKGLLRAKHNLNVNKDGTIRYDMTEMPITHFKAKEIGTKIEKLKELGYEKDIFGKELENENQVLELFPHDIVLPCSKESGDEPADSVFFNVSKFIDEELEKIYKQEKFFNFKNKEDLLGAYFACIAPHICTATVGRVIGFSKTQGMLASPYMHAAMRRDCLYPTTNFAFFDGDEIKYEKIGPFVEKLIAKGAKRKIIDSFGTERIEIDDNVFSFGVDPKTMKLKKKKIKYFIKGAIPEKWIKVTTASGREQIMTASHKFMHLNKNNRFEIKRAEEAKEGDRIALLKEFNYKINKDKINLFKILIEKVPDEKLNEIRLVDAREFFIKFVNKIGKKKILSITGKQKISFYDWYNLVPLGDIKKLVASKVLDFKNIPKQTKISTIFNNKLWPLELRLDKDLATILGYYSSEGHSRQNKWVSQVSFRMMDKDQMTKLVSAIRRYFELEPSLGEDNTKVTICNKLVYYLFKYCFDVGEGAYEKKVPQIVFSASDIFAREYVSCFFDGDGTILNQQTGGRRRVVCFYSVSRSLLDGISLICSRWGLFGRFSRTKERLPGKKVLERYVSLKKEPKKHILNHLTYSGIDFYKLAMLLEPVNEHKQLLVKKARMHKILSYQRKLLNNGKVYPLESEGDIFIDYVKKVESFEEKINSYCFQIDWKSEEDKNVLWNEQILNARCDGDEAAVMLFMDLLLNFSRKYLPAHRGGTQDAPLVLNIRIRAGDVDDQILDFESGDYTLELYELAEQGKHSSEVKSIETIKTRLKIGKDPFIGIPFSHDVEDFNHTVLNSAYKSLPTMGEKVAKMMMLDEKIRAVDITDVARLMIERHFIRDTRGNLRKFSQQGFRCTSCNNKYRRPPLNGKCKCSGRLIFTISEGSILKYMQPALELARKYKVSAYLLESLELTEMYIQSIFGKEKEKQEALGKWF